MKPLPYVLSALFALSLLLPTTTQAQEEIGRFQLVAAPFTYIDTKGIERTDRRILKIDTATGRVWYLNRAFVTVDKPPKDNPTMTMLAAEGWTELSKDFSTAYKETKEFADLISGKTTKQDK